MKENNTYHEGMEANNLPDSLRVNPFDVPEGYFKDLHESLISQVKLESLQKKISMYLLAILKNFNKIS